MEPGTGQPCEYGPNGLQYWMTRVLRERERARGGFEPEAVHDLRVALRRCRSIADGYMIFDPHPSWGRMKRSGRQLFRELGELRDTQVMAEWVGRIPTDPDATAAALLRHLAAREAEQAARASGAVLAFDRKKWAGWIRPLSGRIRRIPPGSMAFRHLALERWAEARALHAQALRNRSHAAYHRLRIGLKKFRYTAEHFLPDRYEDWGGEMGELQDLLGEMHDLHVLWTTAAAIRAFPDEESRQKWKRLIAGEIQSRRERYRQAATGPGSKWDAWRAGLPRPEHVPTAALARLRTWASFRSPVSAHANHVARLSLQIYDGLEALGWAGTGMPADARFALKTAALVHEAGIGGGRGKHHLRAYRMIRKMPASPGLDAGSLKAIALIVRFHRGAPPRPGQKALSGLPPAQARSILLLCGILRLAHALDWRRPKRIPRLTLSRGAETLRIHAPGYTEEDASAEKISAARHLLETCCATPILISPE